MPTASSSKPTGSSKTKSKPYDRDLPKSFTSLKSEQQEDRGAPATLTQKSRKGKKAWRKNIDTREEEEAMEQAREEERVTGGRYSEKKDGELFTVDIVGDPEVAQRMRRAPKPLRSLAVLSETTAVPSLTSRSKTASSKKAKPISKAEKVRLRRIARKEMEDPVEHVGAADVKVDSTIPKSDAWSAVDPSLTVTDKSGRDLIKSKEFGGEGMMQSSVKAPRTLAEQRRLRQGRLEMGLHLLDETPEAGTSYNPTAESHAALMEKAIEEELELLNRERQQEEQIKQLGEVVVSRRAVNADPRVGEFADGMVVDTLSDASDSDSEAEVDANADTDSKAAPKKPTVRKTQAQRNKALRRKIIQQEEEREKRMRSIHKQLGASAVHEIKKQAEMRMEIMKEKERLAKLNKKEKERMGLEGGEKIGRFKVGKKRVDVQLGEDLAESLRQVKPEGNLFKDRFVALQKKALVEPRMPQLPQRRVRKIKEYEKHAWKDFK